MTGPLHLIGFDLSQGCSLAVIATGALEGLQQRAGAGDRLAQRELRAIN